MEVLGKDVAQLAFRLEPAHAWVRNFVDLMQQDPRMAMNYAAKADTANEFRRACNELWGSEELGAMVFDAFYAPGREPRLGMKVGSCAYPRCSVDGKKKVMVYQLSAAGGRHVVELAY